MQEAVELLFLDHLMIPPHFVMFSSLAPCMHSVVYLCCALICSCPNEFLISAARNHRLLIAETRVGMVSAPSCEHQEEIPECCDESMSTTFCPLRRTCMSQGQAGRQPLQSAQGKLAVHQPVHVVQVRCEISLIC